MHFSSKLMFFSAHNSVFSNYSTAPMPTPTLFCPRIPSHWLNAAQIRLILPLAVRSIASTTRHATGTL